MEASNETSNPKAGIDASVSIEDDMDDDFDDLLNKFKPTTTESKQPSLKTPLSDTDPLARSKGTLGDDDDDDEKLKVLSDEFERDLAEGMEALLAGLKQEDGGQFKKHLEDLVSKPKDESLPNEADLKDLLAALNDDEPNSNHNNNNSDEPKIEMKNFQDAIKETMEKLKQSESSAKASTSGPAGAGGTEDEHLAALFEQMMSGEGDLADDNQLQNMLQSFMEELMSKEIMYEPLKDIDRQYPAWLESNRSKLSAEDFNRYQTQSEIVSNVIKKFEHPLWDEEEKAGGDKFITRQKEVVDLLTKMQACGPPPQEILGEMPPGMLGEDGMPNPEQCNLC